MHLRPATAADTPAAHALLRAHRLPLDGLPADLVGFVVVEDAGAVVGLAGVERVPVAALLRSVATSAPGQGVGQRLVAHLLAEADAEGRDVYLLTTTAEGYFPRFGFQRIARADVPAALQASAEFQGACPASATVMRRRAGQFHGIVASGTET